MGEHDLGAVGGVWMAIRESGGLPAPVVIDRTCRSEHA